MPHIVHKATAVYRTEPVTSVFQGNPVTCLPTSLMVVSYRGGTQISVGQGCATRASKPLPIFKGDFGRKGYPFLRIFLEK